MTLTTGEIMTTDRSINDKSIGFDGNTHRFFVFAVLRINQWTDFTIHSRYKNSELNRNISVPFPFVSHRLHMCRKPGLPLSLDDSVAQSVGIELNHPVGVGSNGVEEEGAPGFRNVRHRQAGNGEESVGGRPKDLRRSGSTMDIQFFFKSTFFLARLSYLFVVCHENLTVRKIAGRNCIFPCSPNTPLDGVSLMFFLVLSVKMTLE